MSKQDWIKKNPKTVLDEGEGKFPSEIYPEGEQTTNMQIWDACSIRRILHLNSNLALLKFKFVWATKWYMLACPKLHACNKCKLLSLNVLKCFSFFEKCLLSSSYTTKLKLYTLFFFFN